MVSRNSSVTKCFIHQERANWMCWGSTAHKTPPRQHWAYYKVTQTAMKVGLTLAQRRDDSTDVGQTLGQPTLLSGKIRKRHTPMTQWGRVTRTRVSKPEANNASDIYMNKFWFTVNSILCNKLQWNEIRIQRFFFQCNLFGNVFLK